MKNIGFLIICLMIFVTKESTGYNFSDLKIHHNKPVKPGSIIKCDFISIHFIHEANMPKTFMWAKKKGLIKEDEVTGKFKFSDKVSTLNKRNKRVLCVGCWIVDMIRKKLINGRELYYAMSVYHINDLVKDSPIYSSRVCFRHKITTSGFEEGDYVIFYEHAKKGVCNGKMEMLFEDMEGYSSFFLLKLSSFYNDHVVHVK